MIMTATIIENIPFKPDLAALIDKMRITDRKPLIKEFRQILEEAESIANPKAMYCMSTIEKKGEDFVVIEGQRFESKILCVNLEKTDHVFTNVSTCGVELASWSGGISGVLHKFWADAICDFALTSAVKRVQKEIKKHYKTGYISSMTPGSLEDWPISEQKKLFNLLENATAAIGVSLTERYYMTPVKTVSCLTFPSDEQYYNCQLCSMDSCPNRRAPFDEHLMDKKYRDTSCMP